MTANIITQRPILLIMRQKNKNSNFFTVIVQDQQIKQGLLAVTTFFFDGICLSRNIR